MHFVHVLSVLVVIIATALCKPLSESFGQTYSRTCINGVCQEESCVGSLCQRNTAAMDTGNSKSLRIRKEVCLNNICNINANHVGSGIISFPVHGSLYNTGRIFDTWPMYRNSFPTEETSTNEPYNIEGIETTSVANHTKE